MGITINKWRLVAYSSVAILVQQLLRQIKLPQRNEKIQRTKIKKWTGLDTFESVFTTVGWKLGPADLFMHASCYIKLCRPRKLVQVEKSKEKQLQNVVSQDECSLNSSTTVTDETFSCLPPSAGVAPDKTKCIQCFK